MIRLRAILQKLPHPVLFVVAAATLGSAFGRSCTPAKVVTHEHETVKTVVQEDTQAREQVKALTAQVEDLKRHTHKTEVINKHKDGSEKITIVTDTKTDRQIDTKTDVYQQASLDTSLHVDTAQTIDKSKIVERAAAKWHVGVLAYLDPQKFRLVNPGAALSAGVFVGRSWGPFELDISATVPTASPVKVPTFGLSFSLGI